MRDVLKLSVLSLVMLVAQVVLLGYTALFLPRRIGRGILSYVGYSAGVFGLWVVFAVLAMLLDSAMKVDVPGLGYLVIGGVGWVVGSIVWIWRG